MCRYLEYKDIRIGTPNVDVPDAPGVYESVTPQQCRLRDMTYYAQILVDIEYTRYAFQRALVACFSVDILWTNHAEC